MNDVSSGIDTCGNWSVLGLYFKVAKGKEGREEEYRQGDNNMDATVGERDDLELSNGGADTTICIMNTA
jgi:hypothetical protein